MAMKRRVLVHIIASTLALASSAAADSLSQRVRKLERQVAAHTVKVAELEQKSASTSEQIAQILIGLNTQAQQIATLAGYVAAISNDVNALSQQTTSLQQKVSALEQKVVDLQSQVDGQITALGALLGRVQALEQRVAVLEAGPPAGGPNAPIAVDCGAGQSLAAAIAQLKPGANTITVSGACSEPAVVNRVDDLALIAQPGASIPSASVTASTNVRIVGFHIQGGGTAISVDRGSVVEIKDNTMEGVGTGISLVSSQGLLSGNKVLLPTAFGISLSERSTATIQGLLVLQGGQGNPPGVVGLAVTGGSRARLDSLLPDSLIYDFATGVRVVENSSLSIVPGDTPTPLLKIWRNAGGVTVNASSFNVVGNVPFDNNARAITASDGASVSLSTGVTFVGNQPTGLSLSNGTSARVGTRVTFTGVGTAVDVAVNSSVLFSSSPVTFTTNGKDINCDAYSVAAGVSRTNAATITCPNVQP